MLEFFCLIFNIRSLEAIFLQCLFFTTICALCSLLCKLDWTWEPGKKISRTTSVFILATYLHKSMSIHRGIYIFIFLIKFQYTKFDNISIYMLLICSCLCYYIHLFNRKFYFLPHTLWWCSHLCGRYTYKYTDFHFICFSTPYTSIRIYNIIHYTFGFSYHFLWS